MAVEIFAVPFGLILIIFFIAFAAYLAWWTLEPINRVAGQLRFATRFMLTDFLGLMILLQLPLAMAGRAIESSEGETHSYWLLLLIASAIAFVLWMASVSVVSRAGITRIWRRLCVIVLLVPGTLILIVAWPLSIALLFTWIVAAPDHLLNVLAVVLIVGALVGITLLIRHLSFWSLLGSPGEAILASLTGTKPGPGHLPVHAPLAARRQPSDSANR